MKVANISTIWDMIGLCLMFLTFGSIATVILVLRDTRGRFSIAMLLGLMAFVAVFFGVVIPLGRWLTH
jgi:hypothetical protein